MAICMIIQKLDTLDKLEKPVLYVQNMVGFGRE